jgi:hypothetical protein
VTEPIRPVTPVRTLPNVLRQSLAIPPDSARMLLGTVVSAPDNVRVVVDIGGSNVTIPRLTSYVAPIPGEPCAIVTSAGYTIAVGSVRAAAASAGTKFTRSATPPASPTDGDYWLLPTSSGAPWMFVYDAGSASTYKWEFVGGPPLYASLAGSTAITPGGGWLDLDGPRITAPRAGDYDLEAGATIYTHTGGSGASHTVSLGVYTLGGGPATFQMFTGWLDTEYRALVAADRLLAVAAGSVFTPRYSVTAPAGYTSDARMRWLTATPVRIS